MKKIGNGLSHPTLPPKEAAQKLPVISKNKDKGKRTESEGAEGVSPSDNVKPLKPLSTSTTKEGRKVPSTETQRLIEDQPAFKEQQESDEEMEKEKDKKSTGSILPQVPQATADKSKVATQSPAQTMSATGQVQPSFILLLLPFGLESDRNPLLVSLRNRNLDFPPSCTRPPSRYRLWGSKERWRSTRSRR